jgi:subtilisin family serine protease
MVKHIYIVTLYKEEDLEDFYSFMEKEGIELILKRPESRNTHYLMTEDEAEKIRSDSRVWDVQRLPEEIGMIPIGHSVNNTTYNISGNFWKDDTVGPATISPLDNQWGFLHCAGTALQRRKGSWGSGATLETVNDTVNIFNDGRHVDVVVCDDPVSFDCEEWKSPSTNQSRFVQYQWFNELNEYVQFTDKDGETLPTGNVTYYSNANNPIFHGTHVAGTIAGKHYGWAREANIYALQVLGTMPSGQSLPPLLIFDYLRAFHKNKPINPQTGRQNLTITNHSWGYSWGSTLSGLFPSGFTIDSITSISYNGVTYNSSNPGPSGWTIAGIEADFGIGANKTNIPADFTAIKADVEDAIKDGVIVISSAGNSNYHSVRPSDPEYNNIVTINGFGSVYFNRGSSPANSTGAICVGALSKFADFRRSTYSNFGPRVDIFAPGDNITSAYNNEGLLDSKYGGDNYFYPISGTSMASPQVAGVAALLASNRKRFTNDDLLGYLQNTSTKEDMSFNLNGGDFADNSCQKQSPNVYLKLENPRATSGVITLQVGKRNTSGVTFPRIKTLN